MFPVTHRANSTILWPILVTVQSIFLYCLRCQLRHVVLTGQNGRQVIACEGTFIFVPQPAGREPAGLLNVISQRPESLPSKFFMFCSFGGWKWALGFVCALRMYMHSFFFCYRQYCESQFLSEKICHHLVPHFKRMRWYLPHWEWFCLPLVMQAPLAPIQIWMLRCVSVNNSHVPISLAPRIPPPSLLLQTTKKRCWFAGILPGSQQFFPAQSQSSRGF